MQVAAQSARQDVSAPRRTTMLEAQDVQAYRVTLEYDTPLHSAAEWSDCIGTGHLELALLGTHVALAVVDPETGAPLAQCTFRREYHESFVKRATDSNRCFAVRTTDESGQPRCVGIGFARPDAAIDFHTALMRAQEDDSAEHLMAIRRLVGPHASAAELGTQLRRFAFDARRAANTYLRAVCASGGPPFDFQPRLPPLEVAADGPQTSSSHTAGASNTPSLPWQELEAQLFPAASFLGLRELAATLALSPAVRRRLAEETALWSTLFNTVFGEHAAAGEDGPVILQQRADLCSRFAARYRREKSRVCPLCHSPASLVPVVYGFPSPALAVHHHSGLIVLTEACGHLGPVWACRRCRAEWEVYPYATSSTPSRGQRRKDVRLPPTLEASPRSFE